MAHPQQSATLPGGPESASVGVTVSGSVQKYAIKKKKILNAEESELFELTQAAGIVMDQEVFKIIVDLLKMNVAPLAVFQTLKAMCAGQRIAESSAGDSSVTPQPPTAPPEARAVRSKTGPSHGEKNARDGSSQRVPRQPSASRGPKSGKSSGSSSSSSQLTSS
ncbi:mitotic-spindle organizing protein 2 isoform X2 [Brienomyrus brachyistius]|uniref:mitotic-spindle organizing protein 2 isoform X2 n=1 Tax=Brienomyrus brachyistius TaxID=42636 RepID=UPI0020B18E2C|nr:mitotic-spindle organizing protein 2 isoform X2 [Brienomyrus brachyistius]